MKTLDYQDKPDYQHLQDVLASASSGSLDFLLPPAGPLKQVPDQRIRAVMAMLPVPWLHSLNCCILPLPSAAGGGVGGARPAAGGEMQFSTNLPQPLLDPASGPARALSMAQFEEIDGAGMWPMSPITLRFHLLLMFHFHAEVLASLINTSGHLRAV